MVGIGLMIPADNGIDVGELRLDEHLGMKMMMMVTMMILMTMMSMMMKMISKIPV